MNVKLSGIELSYSCKDVLRGVNVDFPEGKIHALLGENGAGKSSLMKILTGFIQPTKGTVFLNDKKVNFKNPSDSLRAGIACVYQRPYLSDNLSVKDNLKIGINRFTRKNIFLSSDKIFFLEEISLDERVSDLSGDKRFSVALAAALLRNPKVLILDEPTALLNEVQSLKLFNKLRELAFSGMNIIVITHKVCDLQFCDDVTKLVEGKILEDFSDYAQYSDDSDFIDCRENNKTEKSESAKCKLNAIRCRELRRDLRKGRNAVIPSDRTYLASNPFLTVTQLVCSTFSQSADPLIRKKHTEELILKAGIKIRAEERVGNLSGGMLQRLILERELWNNPEVIYLEDPFQGLDTASCEKLSARLKECEKQGSKVVYL